MGNGDVDDIFKDFEHKVEGKKEPEKHEKKPEKELNEGEILKNKYQQAEDSLKQKYKKEKEVLEEKRKKEMTGQETMPSKSSPNIEKVAYIAIILVLAAYIAIDLSFYHVGSSDVEEQAITAAAVKDEGTNEIEEVVEEVIEEELVEEEVEEEIVLSGMITLDIDNIYTKVIDEDNDWGEISKIVFTIDNGKDNVLTPVVNVYAYDDEMDEKWETWSRGEYTYEAGIASGKKHTGVIDLTPKTFQNLDVKKNIRLTLHDDDGDLISAVNEKVLIE